MGIVGAGRAATLHAEAVRAAPGVTLAGVSTLSPESPRAAALAGAMDCRVPPLAELAGACDVAVIATPPAACAAALAGLAPSGRLRAVLVESPPATTVDGIAVLQSVFADRPIMASVNLLHAPAVRRVLETVATMDPHHLELRLAVPDPARGLDGARSFGGGVTVDPGAGFWPVVISAMGSPIESVAVPRADVADGLDRAALIVLRSIDGRTARADLRWGARVAEASIEAADPTRVARVDIWPVPLAEIDGAPASATADQVHPLVALGFVAQVERLARVARGEVRPWPDLGAAASALTVATAAAMSVRRGGAVVGVVDTPRDASPFEILGAPADW